MFDGKAESLKIIISSIAAGLINALGGNYRYLLVVWGLMVCDTALGWLKAKKLGSWKSKTARWGAAGKIVELMLIAIMGALDWALGTGFLMSAGIFYYGIVEFASILENINDGGLTVLPTGLVDVVHKLKFSAGTVLVQWIKKMITDAVGIDVDTVKEKEKEKENK